MFQGKPPTHRFFLFFLVWQKFPIVFFLYIGAIINLKLFIMKKVFLFCFLLFGMVCMSTEVYPTVDDDVGVELVSGVENQALVGISLEVATDYSMEYQGLFCGMLSEEPFEIDNSFYVSDSKLDLHKRVIYKLENSLQDYKPPLATNLYLSSYCSVDKRVSLRA